MFDQARTLRAGYDAFQQAQTQTSAGQDTVRPELSESDDPDTSRQWHESSPSPTRGAGPFDASSPLCGLARPAHVDTPLATGRSYFKSVPRPLNLVELEAKSRVLDHALEKLSLRWSDILPDYAAQGQEAEF